MERLQLEGNQKARLEREKKILVKAASSQHDAAGSSQHPLETASGTEMAWRHLPCAHRRCLHREIVIWSEQLIPESISRGFGHLC